MMNSDEQTMKRTALIVASVTSFMIPFSTSSINLAIPIIGREFAMDAVSLSWLATSFLLTTAMLLLPLGRAADIYGKKRVFASGLLIFFVASTAAIFSTSSELLLIFRALQGVGASMIFGIGIAILTSVYPPGERGRVLGINISAVYLGLSAGPFIGGVLTYQLGWRSLFVVSAVGSIVLFLAVMFKLKHEWREAAGERYDWLGAISYMIMIAFTVLGLSSLPAVIGIASTAIALVALTVFINCERRIDHPIFDIRLFGDNRIFVFSNIATLINYSATFSVSFLMSLYLQYIRGFNPQTAGLVLVSQPIIMAIVSPYAGKLSDKIESRTLATIGMIIIVIGLLALSTIDETRNIMIVVSHLLLIGFGFALFSSPNINAVMGSVQKKQYGVASAANATMRLAGQGMSYGIAAFLFSIYVGRVELSNINHEGLLPSIKIAFAIFAALCIVGACFSYARGREPEEVVYEV